MRPTRIVAVFLGVLAVAGSLLVAPSAQAIGNARDISAEEYTQRRLGWVATLSVQGALGPKTGQFCQGSLIDPSWVLTAAHCLDGKSPDQLQVMLGARALPAKPGALPPGAEAHEVAGIYWIKDYETSKHDLGLVRLTNKAAVAPVTLAGIGPIPLGTPLEWFSNGPKDALFIADVLQGADVKTVAPIAAECAGRICVEGAGRTPTAMAGPGDSGMPYVMVTAAGPVLAGVHRGRKPTEKPTFAVATAVGGQLPWIQECMRRCHLAEVTAVRWVLGDPPTYQRWRPKIGAVNLNDGVIDINFPENMRTVTAAGKARVTLTYDAAAAPGTQLRNVGTWNATVRPVGHPAPSCTTNLLLTRADCTAIIVKQARELISVYFPVRYVVGPPAPPTGFPVPGTMRLLAADDPTPDPPHRSSSPRPMTSA